MYCHTFTVLEVQKTIQTDFIIPRGLFLFDIDNRNPKIDRKDPKRMPQKVILKSPTKTKKSPTKTKKRKKEREHHDRPDNNKQLRVDEQLDQPKILLEIETMEELNRSNTPK